MVAQNALLEKVGLPIVDVEEHEDVLATFSILEDPDSLEDSVMASDADTAPGDELKNVFYVNFNPDTDTMSDGFREQLQNLKQNIDLNRQFLSVKANAAVKAKVDSGELEDQETPRANYRAKVTNLVASTAPWTAGFSIKILQKQFKVEKNVFHQTLISTFTQGLNLPASINKELEGVLTNIKNTINVSSGADGAKQNLMFYILVTIFKKDDVLKAWQPYIRTIYFRVNQSMSTFTKTKRDKSSGFNVEVDIEYVQTDGEFNDKLFGENAKAGIEALIKGKTKSFIDDTFDVSV